MKSNNPMLPLALIGCLCILATSLAGARKTFLDPAGADKNSTQPTGNSTKPLPTGNSTIPLPSGNSTKPLPSGNATQPVGNTAQQCGKIPGEHNKNHGPEGWQFFGTVVGERETLYCGATVISPRQVITSRTCGYGISSISGGRSLRVVLGDHRRQSDAFVGQVNWSTNDCSSTNYSIRPSINGIHQSMNDFLVIPLEEQLTFNNLTQPVCLPSPTAPIKANETSHLRCLQISHKHQDPLEVESFEVEYTKCWLENESQFCFLRKNDHINTNCMHDSGSPIICHKDNKWHMIGMVTTINPTCNSGTEYGHNVAIKLSYIQRLESFKKCLAMK